jgi:hypothetical protein
LEAKHFRINIEKYRTLCELANASENFEEILSAMAQLVGELNRLMTTIGEINDFEI